MATLRRRKHRQDVAAQNPKQSPPLAAVVTSSAAFPWVPVWQAAEHAKCPHMLPDVLQEWSRCAVVQTICCTLDN